MLSLFIARLGIQSRYLQSILIHKIIWLRWMSSFEESGLSSCMFKKLKWWVIDSRSAVYKPMRHKHHFSINIQWCSNLRSTLSSNPSPSIHAQITSELNHDAYKLTSLYIDEKRSGNFVFFYQFWKLFWYLHR